MTEERRALLTRRRAGQYGRERGYEADILDVYDRLVSDGESLERAEWIACSCCKIWSGVRPNPPSHQPPQEPA